MRPLSSLGKGLEWLAGLILPMFARARDGRGLGPRTRMVLRLVVLAAILGALAYVNERLDLERILRSPLPVLRRVWLPLLFLLVYALAWLGWWLWCLLAPEVEISEFPDIDAAWAEARRALDRASIDLTAAPLFLVLGRPRGTEEALFHAADLRLEVGNAPRDPESPLHLFANRDGIFLTCAGASLLGRQATLLAEAVAGAAAGTLPGAPPTAPAALAAGPAGAALVPELRGLGDAPDALGALLGRPAAGPPRAGLRTALAAPLVTASRAPRRRAALIGRDEAAALSARLAYLGRLIARDRRPYCPVNGLLWLIPRAALDGDADADQTGDYCRRDLAVLRDALQVRCPSFAMLCDMEEAPGFREFVACLPEALRLRFLGLNFPLMPANPAAAPAMIEDGLRWVAQMMVPTLIYRLLRVEGPGEAGPAAAVRENIRFFGFLGAIRARHARLAGLLNRGLTLGAAGPALLGGFYFAGTGRDAGREQAFVAGVFQRLLESQNAVAWTPEARAEEAGYRRWARRVGVAVGAYVVALVVLGWAFWPR